MLMMSDMLFQVQLEFEDFEDHSAIVALEMQASSAASRPTPATLVSSK